MINVVLMSVESPDNLGAVARVMKNFGFKKLILVSPKAGPKDIKARIVSRHAEDILKKAVVLKKFPFLKFDYIIGTTARIGTDYNIIRTPLSPDEAVEKILRVKGRKTAIVFGPESSGLDNNFLSKCDFVIKIPASKYDTLNLSHAVAIILYELFKAENKGEQKFEKIEPISSIDKNVLEKKFLRIAKNLFDDNKLKVQVRVWKRLLGKATLSKREAFALLGFLSRVEYKLKNKRNLNKHKKTK